MTRTSQNDSRARLRAHLDAEDGVAMILALVILIVIAIVGGSVIFFSSSNARSAEYSAANSGAHSLAESGIANAMAVISHPASNRANASLLPQTTTTYDEGDVVWSGAYDPVFAVWTLTSTAYISNPSAPNDVDRTVTAKVWTADTVFTSTLDPGDGTTDREIWVMNLDGSGKYNVTDNDWEDGDAFWSPDTGTFVYETEKDKDAVANAGKSNAGGPSNTNREIYSMNVDGSGQTRLTVNQGVAGQKCSSADEDPQWGPNNKIAFDTFRNGHCGSPTDATRDNWDVYVMDQDGSDLVNLTPCILSPTNYWVRSDGRCSNDQEPAYGAGGLACIQSNAGSTTTHLHAIPISVDGLGNVVVGTPYLLVASSGKDRECDWSPDGTQLTYMSDRDGDYEIFVLDIATMTEAQITNNSIRDEHPGWTADGRIVFNSKMTSGAINSDNADGGEEMFVMNSDGSNIWQLTVTTQAGVENRFPDVRDEFEPYDFAG